METIGLTILYLTVSFLLAYLLLYVGQWLWRILHPFYRQVRSRAKPYLTDEEIEKALCIPPREIGVTSSAPIPGHAKKP